MGRPIYPFELADPDFAWLVTSYIEMNPDSLSIERTCMPVVFLRLESEKNEMDLTDEYDAQCSLNAEPGNNDKGNDFQER